MRILVAGLGNVLMSDDGFGPQVIQALAARYESPAGVEFEDLGTSDVLLIGVVPAGTSLGTRLSRPVRDAVPAACAAVVEELARLGRPVLERTEADGARPWWDRTAT